MWYKKQDVQGPKKRLILGDVELTIADRQPCPVCGHPTGDCIDEKNPPDDFERVAASEAAPANKNMVKVPYDVIEDIWLTPKTKSRKIVARKGTYITVEKAKKIGLL